MTTKITLIAIMALAVLAFLVYLARDTKKYLKTTYEEEEEIDLDDFTFEEGELEYSVIVRMSDKNLIETYYYGETHSTDIYSLLILNEINYRGLKVG